MTKREREEDLKHQQAFELALFRVRMRNKKNGVVMMFSQLLDETEKELQRENQRLAARIAEFRCPCGVMSRAQANARRHKCTAPTVSQKR